MVGVKKTATPLRPPAGYGTTFTFFTLRNRECKRYFDHIFTWCTRYRNCSFPRMVNNFFSQKLCVNVFFVSDRMWLWFCWFPRRQLRTNRRPMSVQIERDWSTLWPVFPWFIWIGQRRLHSLAFWLRYAAILLFACLCMFAYIYLAAVYELQKKNVSVER